jgi:hypothetical protein
MSDECRAERVLVEYNGMWLLQDFYDAMPEGWLPYQDMLFFDGNSFLNYNANMRQLVVDKLKDCDVCVFNRLPEGFDTMALHKVVRGVSRRTDILYEFASGRLVPDEIEDPLPFDINAPVVKIEDRDYALFYRDISEDAEKYQKKTLEFTGRVARDEQMKADTFAIGRHVMTCCVEDIQYMALAARWPNASLLKNREWVHLKGTVEMRFSSLYRGKGPVLMVESLSPTEQPEEEVATFF